jgi:hypothetical protein
MNQLAKRIVDLAAHEKVDEPETKPDLPASNGGKARAANLSDARRKAIAKKAARARWRKEKGK